MTNQKLLRLPPLLRRTRLAAGLTQKEAAAAAGVDPSQWCGLENGRKRVASPDRLSHITEVLGASFDLSNELEWARRHDCALEAIQNSGAPFPVVRLVSHCLAAARVLDPKELEGLTDTVCSAVTSKSELSKLADRASSTKEAPMT